MQTKFAVARRLGWTALGLVALAAAGLLVPLAANATPSSYVVHLTQQRNDVVATGSGSIDLTGLTLKYSGSDFESSLSPVEDVIIVGAYGIDDLYTGTINGPASFGSGLQTFADGGSGESVGMFSISLVVVPSGYVSGGSLGTSTATFDGATFASLGVTPGTYTWTWGRGSIAGMFTITTAVPEPPGLGMFGFGLLLLGGGFGWRIWRQRRAA